MDCQSHTASKLPKHNKHGTLEIPMWVIFFQDVFYDSTAGNAPNHCNRSRTWGYADKPFEQAYQICLASRFLDSPPYTQKKLKIAHDPQYFSLPI